MRLYAVINITELDLIDFSQIEETSINTIRKSLDESQFTIKWQEGSEPTFIESGAVIPVGIYTHSECLELMASDKWSEDIETI
jgi:hypothetical protein